MLTREEVQRLTKVGRNTVFNWSKTMRGTDLVVKDGDYQGAPLKFKFPFVVLMLARRGKSTPGAPAPEVIADALSLWPEYTSEKIAERLGVSLEDIEWIGLEDVDPMEVAEIKGEIANG